MSSAEFTEQWAYDVLEQEDQAAAQAAHDEQEARNGA